MISSRILWFPTTTFIKMYIRSSAMLPSMNSTKYIYLVSLSTTTSIELYSIYVIGSLDNGNFIMKSYIIDFYTVSSTVGLFNVLYSICFAILALL
jgi:hypothetical protein